MPLHFGSLCGSYVNIVSYIYCRSRNFCGVTLNACFLRLYNRKNKLSNFFSSFLIVTQIEQKKSQIISVHKNFMFAGLEKSQTFSSANISTSTVSHCYSNYSPAVTSQIINFLCSISST